MLGSSPPLASCIMPTANRRRFIPGAIARFLAQDFAGAELVILDDGEDAVGDLVPDVSNIRYIRTQKYKSLGQKRNAAVEAARSEILLHWDDDDWYAPQRVRVQVEALLASGADICGVDRAFFMDPAARAAWEYVYPQTAAAPWVCGATLCYRRDFWAAHRFTDLQVGEDTCFAAAVHPARLHVLPENRFFVALIHRGYTSPKHVHDSRWRRADFAMLRALTGPDWPAPEPAPSAAPRGPALVAAASGIGDILRVTPLIRALHRLGHGVDVLLAPDNAAAAELLRGAPEINALHVVRDTTQGAVPPVPPPLAAAQYQLAVFARWAAPLARQVHAAKTLHFHPATWLEQGDSACVAAIAREAGWAGALPPPFAQTSGRDFALPPGTIGLHPGCKPGWPWKRWHGFAELAAMLEHVVILGTAADQDTSGTYFPPFSWPAHAQNFTGQLSLADSAALISQCAAFVANDSGLMHLAAPLGVPTLGVFGITSPMREAMDIPAMHPVSKGLDCEPACRREAWGRRDCAQHLACLKSLTATEVHARLTAIIPATETQAMLRQPFPPNPLPIRPRAAPPPQPAAPPPAVHAKLRLAVRMEGGIGDVILAARLVEAAYLALGHCEIDLFHHNVEAARFVFHGTGFIRAFYPSQMARNTGYDVTVYTQHYANFIVHDAVRLRQLAPDAVSWLGDAASRFAAYRGLSERQPNLDGLWGRLSVRQGRNVLDNLGFLSGLEINRATQVVLTPDIAAIETLPALLGPVTGAYITVHDGFDNNMRIAPGQATKCWPLGHWTAFVAALHVAAPEVKIVQLGGNKSRAIAGVNVNLLNRTNLHQAAWILQNAMLHVDTDSGLVHLAQAMHTKAIVLYGPTDAGLYGHDEHTILQAGDCNGCWWSTPDWLARCPRGLAQPACMVAITPEQVLEATTAALAACAPPRAELLGAGLYDGALLEEHARELTEIFAAAGLAPARLSEHAHGAESGAYLHASKQWEYLFALSWLRAAMPDRPRLRILDAGGGRGALPLYFAARGHDVEVIDRDYLWDHGGDLDIERRYMRACADKGLRIRHGGIHNLPVADASFDVVTCISVVEHVQGKAVVLRELLRVLRPGGLLVLTFDIAADPKPFEDGMRVEIFSPVRLRDCLKIVGLDVGLDAEIFTAGETGVSAVRIQQDGVAGIPAGMTVGGVVLRKSG